MTFSFSWIFRGVPSAIFSPKFSTTMRSEIFITAGMSCSTSRTVTPRLRTPRTISTVCMVSSWFMPAKGSSSSRTAGFVARPMAMPSARRWPCGSVLAISFLVPAEAEEIDDLVGRAAELLLVALGRPVPR